MPATREGDLALLIETERRLDEDLAAASAEAARVREAARAAAQELERRLADEVAAATLELRSRLEAELRQRLAAIGDDAQRQVETFERVGAHRVQTMARDLVARLIADGAAAA